MDEIRRVRIEAPRGASDLLYETAVSSGFGVSREKFKHDIIKHIDFEDDIIRLLEDDSGRILGFYRAAPWPRRAKKTEAAYLFDDMFHVLRREGYKELYSRSSRQNDAGAALHSGSGFEVAKESALWTEWVKRL